jgi:hypothetical protein
LGGGGAPRRGPPAGLLALYLRLIL